MDLMALPSGGAEASIEHALETCQHWQKSQQATRALTGSSSAQCVEDKRRWMLGSLLV